MKIRIDFGTYLLGALCLLLLPYRWLLGMALAVAAHELSHILMLTIFRIPVSEMIFTGGGMRLVTPPMSPGHEALCALAGPMGSILTAFLCKSFPEAALIAAFQGAYNLIPVHPLDGGRILRAIFPDAVCEGIEIFTLVLLLGGGIWYLICRNLGFIAIFPAISVGLLRIQRKFPCKAA